MGSGQCHIYALVFMIGCVILGQAIEADTGCIVDLVAGLNSSLETDPSYFKLHPRLKSKSPVLILKESSRYLKVHEPVTEQILSCLQKSRELSLLATVKQDLIDSGSIVAFSSDLVQFLEVESSGRRNEIRVYYSSSRETLVESFPYHLADATWHRITVTFTDKLLTLYVDCQQIYQRPIKPIDRVFHSPEKLDLFVGQRNRRHALFRGALQDVKIVTETHGHLLQCPEIATDSNKLHIESLSQKFDEMWTLYENMSAKLDDVQKRLRSREQCDCQRNCRYNKTVIQEGHQWSVNCSTCTCKKGRVVCHKLQCPAATCKHPVFIENDFCCPVCLSHCYRNGVFYDHGETFSPRVCVSCVCNDGKTQCEKKDPMKSCPTLKCPEEEQLSVQGECCPVCQGTDFCSQGHDCHSNSTCVNLATRYACQCLPGFHGNGRSCTDIDECKSQGGRFGHHCVGETHCVNTLGSYRCVCPAGQRSIDHFSCLDINECNDTTHDCHRNAICVNTPGSYKCQCMDGYTGNGIICSAICEKPCKNGGMCISPNTCSCRHGFVGALCEIDIDECSLDIHACQGHSHCVNVPGWYECHCNLGYHSNDGDNLYGKKCIDDDECIGEGVGHTCHPTTVCRNIPGSYMCQCDPTNVPCSHDCVQAGVEHKDGSTWPDPHEKCHDCVCNNGVTRCSKMCRCSEDDASDCCPHCEVTGDCQHQELPTVINNGGMWTFRCQTCECLNGEIDCWPIVCRQLSCPSVVQLPGDCCPRCSSENVCVSTTDTDLPKVPSHSCIYKGREIRNGHKWRLLNDSCTFCKCQQGHICCSFNQTCLV